MDRDTGPVAKAEEMSCIKSLPLYEEVELQVAWDETGRWPVSTKWVDIEKDGGVRSRWVARDFKPKGEKGRDDLFAATPPLEAKKLLM